MTTTQAARPARRARARSAKGDAVATNNDRRSWPYRFELVPLDRLFVDADYQRPLTSFVERIANDYDPAKVGTLTVSERKKGPHAIVDGQTRWEATKRQPSEELPVDDAGRPIVPCLVYYGLSREQEAQLFASLQTDRRGMATYLRFRASLVAKD